MSDSEFRLSFEFFPPKTDAGREKLVNVRNQLATFEPTFFSMTYGAGGSTRDNTKGLVTQFNQEGYATAPHLSFGGDTEESITQLIEEYKVANVNRIVALRGDMPSGMGGASQMVYASELVAFIRQRFDQHYYMHVRHHGCLTTVADLVCRASFGSCWSIRRALTACGSRRPRSCRCRSASSQSPARSRSKHSSPTSSRM